MKLIELMENEILVYGDRVIYDDPDSKYAGMVGKIVETNGSTVKVKFSDVKKPIVTTTNSLKKVDEK